MKKILNIGCGEDTFGTHFVDLYPTRDNVIKCDVDKDELPFEDNFFDEIYAKFIFEHMKNPNLFLKKCYRVLKKGGNLVLITDNAGFWIFHLPIKFCYSREHYDNLVRRGKEDKHYAIYTILHVKNHLIAAGFKDVKVKYLWFQLKPSSFKNKLLYNIFLIVCKIFSFFLPKSISYPHILAIARK